MKQLIFLSILTLVGGIAGIASPFWGILLYYTLAVLRPQYLWYWALPVEVRWSLIAALIVLGGVAFNFMAIMQRAKVNSVALLMLVYGLLVMASVITAFDPNVSQSWAIDFAKILLIALIASFLIQHFWQVRLLAIMVGLTIGYIAYEINFNYFFHNARLDVLHHGYGGLDNNGAGLMLAMGIPFAYCFALSKWKTGLPWQRIVAAGIGLVLLHSVMLTYSRGAMLAAVVGLLWLGWHHRPRWQMLALAPLVLVAMSVLAGPEIRKEFLSTRQFREDRSAQSRFDSWAAAWEMAWDRPIFGTGFRNSNQYSYNYGADRAGRTIHNQYLQIAADSGIPTAAVYLILLGTAIWRCGTARRILLKHHRKERKDDDDDDDLNVVEGEKICLAVQTALVIFAFNGIFLSLETFELPWLLMVVAGVLPHAIERQLEPNKKPEKQRLPKFRGAKATRFEPTPILHPSMKSLP